MRPFRKCLRNLIPLAWVLCALLPPAASSAEPATRGGVYELAIGATESQALALIEYLQGFGYRIGPSGELAAEVAERLYGVDSALRSVRLLHQDADHGLIRVMIWERPLGEGLGLAPMKVVGGRWGAAVTRDVYALVNHAEDASEAGQPILWVEPQRQVIYRIEGASRPFLDPAVCVREMLLVRPLTRQILFQRYGYELPLYGSIDEDSPHRTSQVTHAGLIIQGGSELTDFYEDVLGLLRARDGGVSGYDDEASRNIFELGPDETYTTTDFDDPRSDPADLSRVRSGRLKIIRFPADLDLPDLRQRSRPGHLGLSVYSYRARDLEALYRRVSESSATLLSEVLVNELGERSFTFTAPDGYAWMIVE